MTDYTVSSGVISSGLTLSAGNQLVVLNGGEALDTFVKVGGIEYVSSGGVGSSETISGGEYLSGGAISLSSTIGDGGYLVAYAGAIASSTIINAGGALNVSGTAVRAVLNNGGSLDVYGGGKAYDTSVREGSSQVVFTGANVIGTDVEYGGADYVSSGGIASGSTINQGAYEVLSTGGAGLGTIVSSGGADDVESGGLASFATVTGGGAQVVYRGGVADGSVLDSGGLAFVYSGGAVSGTEVQSGGWLVVLPGAGVKGNLISTGGMVISTGVVQVNGDFSQISYHAAVTSDGTISGGAQQFVLPGGSAVGVTVGGGSTEHVYAGGSTTGVYLNSGGYEFVSSGGTASGSTASGGTVFLFSGSIAQHTVVSAGGVELVASGAVALVTTVASGGKEYVYSGGRTSGTIVDSGGIEYVYSTAVDSGSLVSSGGAEFVYSGGIASNTVVSAGGDVTVYSDGVAESVQVNSAGTVLVSSGGAITATVVANGGTINLAYLPYTNSGGATLVHSTNILTVTEGSTSIELQLGGSYSGDAFGVVTDGTGGTSISPYDSPCYCRGTRILTDLGEVAVEDLAIGDILITHTGRKRPVRWIGWRAYGARFVAGNFAVLPILLKRGALAEQSPKRDLMVSPQHALLLDAVLIPALALVNGGSITQMQVFDDLEYFHLELETHDVIIAEGAAAESFFDDRNRFMFQNAGEYSRLYPDSAPDCPQYCALRLSTGPVVAAIRRRLAKRGEDCGYCPAGLMVISLLVGVAYVTVPAGVGTLRLISTFGKVEGDRRWLGALVTGIVIGGVKLDLDDVRLATGFNDWESHDGHIVRWTTGDAKLNIDPEPFERSCEFGVARVMEGGDLSQVSYAIRIEAPGKIRVMVPAGVGAVSLVSPCGWVPGDIRRLGALITGFSIGDDVLDLADVCFVDGFHLQELHGMQPVRWTNGEAVVAIMPRPVGRWCEIEVAAVTEESDLPFNSFTIEIGMAGMVGVMVPAESGELRLVSPFGWVAGDLRRLGALVVGMSIGGNVVDLSGACFAEGFHAEETRGARTARWTDGDAVVVIEAHPVPRWCEIEIALVSGSSGAEAKAA